MESSNSSDAQEHPVFLFEFTKNLTIYVQPILCLFGFIGNVLSFLVFLSKDMRKISSNIYLAALSGSSCGFMLILLMQWLEFVRMPLMHMSVMCQGIVYFSYVFSFLSVWFVVCITVENYVVTFHLTKASRFCNVTKAKWIVTGITVLAVLLYISYFWTSKVVDFGHGVKICTEDPSYSFVTNIYTYIDITMTLTLPFTATSILIIAILSRNLCFGASSGLRSNGRRLSKTQRSLVKITRVLLAISLTFVLLSGPSHINKLRHIINNELYERQPVHLEDRILQQLFQLLYYCSFCLNFVFYLSWSINFRKGMKKLFKINRRRKSRGVDLNNGLILRENLHDRSTNHTEKITLV